MWYYHLNLGRMGMTLNSSLSVTRMWEFKKITAGIQLGISVVANGKKTDKNAYFVLVPYSVLTVVPVKLTKSAAIFAQTCVIIVLSLSILFSCLVV